MKIPTVRILRPRKTRLAHVIQGRYAGYWEDVTEEPDWRSAKMQLRVYDINEPQYPHRYIQRRVKL